MSFRAQKKVTPQQALTRVERLVARIRNAATRLPDDPGQRAARTQRAAEDFWFFARTYLPHHFTADPAEMHRTLTAVLGEPGVAIFRMPRGFGKSTVGQAYALWCGLFGKRGYILILGKTAETAQELLQTVILELEENSRLAQDYGEQRTKFWSADDGYRLKRSGCWLRALGREMAVRGRKKGAQRPDLIVADDIEDEELVRNPQRIKRLLKWWLQSVLPALAQGGTAVWLCTSLAEKSPSALLLDPAWSYGEAERPPECCRHSFPAENPDGGSVWPELWPDERLAARKAQIGTTAFNAEMLHKAEKIGGLFRSGWFKFYTPEQLPAGCVTVIACDPSARSTDTADCKAVVAWAKDTKLENYYCRRAWIRNGPQATLTAFCVAICDLYATLRPQVVILETNGFQELVKTELLRVAARRNLRLPVKTVEQHTAKVVRIQSLQPLAENGQLWFVAGDSDQDVLREQFDYYPSATVADDGPDASEMAIAYLRPLLTATQTRGYKRVRGRSDVRGVL